ncbi:hypothetical protein AVEN_137592-1 [Araneus ventricosus]|uniref:Uncharacterized protein n=1 Tax=Araneus ventricosus TaxID=182803 RepID=A0A4Y2CUE6_ARAVE|nr:hypothetical protein AVEN_137592-1 [Araneus ventricosus]
MKIGVDRRRSWNSNEAGFPFSPFGHKSKIWFFEAGDKSPVCGRECWEGGMGVEVAIGLQQAGRGGEGALSKKRNSLVWGNNIDQNQTKFGFHQENH